MLHAPGANRLKYGYEIGPSLREVVLIAIGAGLIEPSLHDLKTDQRFEPISQDVGGDIFCASLKIGVSSLAHQQVANEQEAPSIAQHIQRRGGRARASKIGVVHYSRILSKPEG